MHMLASTVSSKFIGSLAEVEGFHFEVGLHLIQTHTFLAICIGKYPPVCTKRAFLGLVCLRTHVRGFPTYTFVQWTICRLSVQ